MNKLFSTLTVKSFDEDEGVFTGIASTPSTDRVGDIVETAGITAKHLPVPLLWQHDHDKPAGIVESMTPTAKGLVVVCRVLKDASAEVKSYWEFVKAGAVSLSIGFRPLEYAPLAAGGYHYKQVELLELSLVTVPAHQDARILTTKQHQAANPVIHIEGNTMTIAEQLKQFESARAEALGKMDALVTKGATLSQDEDTQYKAAETEVASLDQHIERLKAAEARQAKSARPVQGVNVTVQDNAPKGSDFVRFTKALALARGNPMQAVEMAKHLGYGNRVETVLKAAVAAGTTTSADFASLIEPQMMTAEFIDLLRPSLIVSKLTQVRHVPSNIRIPRQTTGTSASWIGEGRPAAVTNAAFGDLELGDHKLGAIAVFTEQLLRRSEPAAENLVRDDLIAVTANAIDVAFITSTNAGVAGVKPASIANGATTAAASGTSADAVRADVKKAYANAVLANQPLASAAWIMHPSTALSLSMMVVPFSFTTNVDSVTQDVTTITSGQREFPGISMNGGTFEGLPVVLSTNVPGDATAGYDLVLAVQNEILLAEGGLAIDASREASLEMDGAPVHDSKTPTAASLVSLWQTGSVAIRVIRGITWTTRRPTAVYRISAAKYA
ncbi:phage major capsid protein [Aromatoleum aromaticum]|uniref:Uncharacterized protein n=1 Tax=Aromatoleum aromaticum (strain DSM 19018 / LMG 30748 / EbN1) TaxID=76114 RepID=Q5P0B6_AROAE|nr:phage major capsid protein [Aromatoleum aromaticum]NMG56722.1 phage major capsid protein [Aromatoleum aromaticum]CAI09248.1 conserved hypothetical protein,(putative major phage head protein/prohead proteinase) [Aromatoleum aromaticum EbN1]